jgi:hypothetical protein
MPPMWRQPASVPRYTPPPPPPQPPPAHTHPPAPAAHSIGRLSVLLQPPSPRTHVHPFRPGATHTRCTAHPPPPYPSPIMVRGVPADPAYLPLRGAGRGPTEARRGCGGVCARLGSGYMPHARALSRRWCGAPCCGVLHSSVCMTVDLGFEQGAAAAFSDPTCHAGPQCARYHGPRAVICRADVACLPCTWVLPRTCAGLLQAETARARAEAEAAQKRAEVRAQHSVAAVWLGCSVPSLCLCCRQVRTCCRHVFWAPVFVLVCLLCAQGQARRAAEAEAARKRVEVCVWWAVVRDGRERLLHPQRSAHAVAHGSFCARAPACTRTHTRVLLHAHGLGHKHMHAR